MPTLQPEQLPAVASALMRLRGDTLNSVGTATGIRAANLSVWLRGKTQVISAKRIAGLMYHLGVEGGKLRGDVLHRWHDTGPFNDVKDVLGKLVDTGATVWLFQDNQPGLTKTRFVQVGDAWIRLELTPGASDAKDITGIVNAARVLTLPTSLATIPSGSLQTAQDALLTIAEQNAAIVGDDELLEGLLFRLSELTSSTVTTNTSSPTGWMQLERALRSAIKLGIDLGHIARLIDDSHRNGGSNSACGRNQESA